MAKKKWMPGVFGLALVIVAGQAFEARAESPQVRTTLFYTPATTELKAPALAGKPSFKNDGDYYGLSAEVYYGKFSINGLFQWGSSEQIEGGADFTAPTFNAVTNEDSTQLDVSIGYQVLDNPYTGQTDLTFGYYRLWAQPEISPANWYNGPEIGLKGRRATDSKLTIIYKLGYVPTYGVHGWVENSMKAGFGNIFIYKLGVEYPLDKNLAVTAGYQGVRLEAEVFKDGSSAVVTLTGFFFGAVVSF